jgi:diguanylate cyclase (GGDEF)-like protein
MTRGTAAFGADTTAEEVLDGVDLTGTTALVTGGSGGLGAETVRALATHGARVVATARDTAKATANLTALGLTVGDAVTVEELDLASLASVRAASDRIAERHEGLNILIANAGVMACPQGTTADGFETQFGTNHLGHFVFVNRLLPLLVEGAPSRVVMLTSAGHRFGDIDLDDVNFERSPYTPFDAYHRAKTANILFAVELDRRWRDRGVRACAVHPGTIDATDIQRHRDRADAGPPHPHQDHRLGRGDVGVGRGGGRRRGDRRWLRRGLPRLARVRHRSHDAGGGPDRCAFLRRRPRAGGSALDPLGGAGGRTVRLSASGTSGSSGFWVAMQQRLLQFERGRAEAVRMGREELVTTEAEYEATVARTVRSFWTGTIFGVLALMSLIVPAAALGMHFGHGFARALYTALFTLVIGAPFVVYSAAHNRNEMLSNQAAMDRLRAELTAALEDADAQANRREAQATQQEFESRLGNALEMASDEGEVIDVVERAFAAAVGDMDAELLLADNSHAHLSRMAASASASCKPMCSVESPDQCPAARRAQVQRFPDSDALDACPKLRGRIDGRCSAVCVPVSIMGRTVGVIHVTGEAEELPANTSIQYLSTLANQAGARVGLLRMMADTQMQASTDSLTGLLNRRAFENAVRVARGEHQSFAVAMADLDHFKVLNDTFGHDTGDRALRLFAQTLDAATRQGDLVARYGGEEFAVVLPSCNSLEAFDILDRVREALRAATNEAGLPTVTVSFGVVDAESHEDLNLALARADAALLEAKRAGRDRIVRHAPERETESVEP